VKESCLGGSWAELLSTLRDRGRRRLGASVGAVGESLKAMDLVELEQNRTQRSTTCLTDLPESSSSSFAIPDRGKQIDPRNVSTTFYRSCPLPQATPKDRGRGRGRWGPAAAMLFTVLTLASCNDGRVVVYRIPKEGIDVAMQSGSAGLVPPPGKPAQWTKPDGWNEQPLSEMRLGSFKVDGPNATSADISVIAFPGEAGGLISNINRWRGQLQLTPLDEDQLSQTVQRTEVDNVPTYLVDFQTAEGSAKPSRILGAVLQTPDRAWFVKMTGPPELIEGQRQQFLTFVKSFHFTSPTGTESPAPSAPIKPKSTNDE
jgi:hypothetical protein